MLHTTVVSQLLLTLLLASSRLLSTNALVEPKAQVDAAAKVDADEPVAICPKEVLTLFPAKNLDQFTTWLKEHGTKDPDSVFRLENETLRITGAGFGYLATRQSYRDYRLVVEYRWGDRTDGGKFVRNSGIMLHSSPRDGTAKETWTTSVECQLAQGCVGDLILIQGEDPDHHEPLVAFETEVEVSPNGRRHRYHTGGDRKHFPTTRGQLWWSKHDWDFAELLDTRGKNDFEKPKGEWNRIECLCERDTITVRVNGEVVNHVKSVAPAQGRILLQSEGFELFVRKLELHPLEHEATK